MNLAADMGRHSGWATPSLRNDPYRQIEEETGRRSTYLLPIAVQTNPATSLRLAAVGAAVPLAEPCIRDIARTSE
jgi:hypothetical protein